MRSMIRFMLAARTGFPILSLHAAIQKVVVDAHYLVLLNGCQTGPIAIAMKK
jgi:hypothetical protein